MNFAWFVAAFNGYCAGLYAKLAGTEYWYLWLISASIALAAFVVSLRPNKAEK